jgi:transcriptional regulator with XRE-family HTH domain
MSSAPPVGVLLRDWRQRRRLSQLDLALEAGVSTRHLSFVETGRSRPSPEMVLHLADELEVPLRERNRLLLAAGYAPVYEERALDEPEMQPVHDAIQLVLDGHDPYPAITVDRGWALVAHNRAAGLLMEGLPEDLLAPPMNVLRASLHPDGSRRGSPTSASGRRTCCTGWRARPQSPATRRCARSTRSSRATRRLPATAR